MSESSKNSRLVLGTVQLGLPYGVANKTGQPDAKLATAIVKEVWDNGIREFDTAQGYGNSESVLGEVFFKLGISDKVRVISKFHPQIDHMDGKTLSKALDESLSKLRIPSLYAILLHNENLLDQWDKGVWNNLKPLIKNGKVKKVGVSVYSVAKAMAALDSSGIDLIQLPANIFDRRFEMAEFFEKAKQKNIAVYIRSVFLQGLLLMDLKDVPAHLAAAKKPLEQLDRFCEKYRLTRRELALGYIGSQMPDAKIVFGVETVAQLKENLLSWNKDHPAAIDQHVRQEFANLPEAIMNPTLWKK